MRKKFISIFMLVLIVATTILSGCSNGKTESTNKSEVREQSDQENKVVNLTMCFWGDVNESKAKQALVDEFNKTHPDIQIKYTYTDGATYKTSLQTYFTSNTAPDIMNVAEDIIYDFQKDGVFEDLKPYMEKDNLLDEVWGEDLLAHFTFNGATICAPHVYKIPAIIYNKDIFDKNDSKYPTEAWTDVQFMDLAKKMTYGEANDKVWGMNFSWFPSSLIRDMFNNPYYIKEENKMNVVANDQFKTSLELFYEIFVEDKSAPDDAAFASVGGGFETGKFAMAMVGAWEITSLAEMIGDNFQWGITKLPINDKYGRWRGINMCDGMAISSKSKQKDAAWEFIKWCTTTEEAQKLSTALGVPALTNYANSEEYLNTYPNGIQKYDKTAFFANVNEAQPWYNTGTLAKINDELNNFYQMYINDEISMDDMISQLDDTGTGIFAQ